VSPSRTNRSGLSSYGANAVGKDLLGADFVPVGCASTLGPRWRGSAERPHHQGTSSLVDMRFGHPEIGILLVPDSIFRQASFLGGRT
jgi:hypothetical protein